MFTQLLKYAWKVYIWIAVAVFTVEIFLHICKAIQIKPYIVLSLIIGEPLICSLVLYGLPMFLIPRKVLDKICDHRIGIIGFMILLVAPFILGLISAIIDLYAYSNTHEQLMFTILGKGMRFV